MISYLHSYNPRIDINENYEYFIAALIYSNIDTGHSRSTPFILMVKELDKETIYFNFKLDFGITKIKDMDEFVSVIKHVKGRESKIPIHLGRKKPKK